MHEFLSFLAIFNLRTSSMSLSSLSARHLATASIVWITFLSFFELASKNKQLSLVANCSPSLKRTTRWSSRSQRSILLPTIVTRQSSLAFSRIDPIHWRRDLNDCSELTSYIQTTPSALRKYCLVIDRSVPGRLCPTIEGQ